MKIGRKTLGIVTVLVLITILAVPLLTEYYTPTRTYGDGFIRNEDVDTFTLVNVTNSSRTVSIRGSHQFLRAPRSCLVQYIHAVPGNESGFLSANVTVNLSYRFVVGLLSSGTLAISYVLLDHEYNELDLVSVFQRTIPNDLPEENLTYTLEGTLSYYLQPRFTYKLAIRLTITLAGESSIEGILPNTPCSLVIGNITVARS